MEKILSIIIPSYNDYVEPVRTFAQERIKAFCQKRLAVVRRDNYTQYLFH